MKPAEQSNAENRFADVNFSRLLGSAAESIVIVGQTGQIIWTNRKTCDLFGYRKEEMMGQAIEMLMPDRFRQAHAAYRAAYFSAPRNRPMGAGFNLAARRKDGTEFPVEISLSYAGGDGALQVMAIITDITRLKRAEAAKEQFRKRQLEQKEEEIRTLERLSRGPAAAVTARLIDMAPLRQYAPTVFNDLVREYAAAMEMALERRIYKTENPLSEMLRNMAEKIGFLKGTPRDVVDIHRVALKRKSEEAQPPKVQGYVEEGHLLLVELMGYLASRYRHHAVEAPQPQGPSGMT